jgi:endophilin-B
MLNRAKQFTEERLGKAERTENDPQFETLAKRSEMVKGYTEKMVKNTEAVLVPNPGTTLNYCFCTTHIPT